MARFREELDAGDHDGTPEEPEDENRDVGAVWSRDTHFRPHHVRPCDRDSAAPCPSRRTPEGQLPVARGILPVERIAPHFHVLERHTGVISRLEPKYRVRCCLQGAVRGVGPTVAARDDQDDGVEEPTALEPASAD